MSNLNSLLREQEELGKQLADAQAAGDAELYEELDAELAELEEVIEDMQEAEAQDHRLARR